VMKIMMKKITALIVLSVLCLMACGQFVHADDDAIEGPEALYVNPSTHYGVYIDDRWGILTPSETKALAKSMESVTEYGNAVFLTEDRSYSPGGYCESYYLCFFGEEVNGVLFYIDPEWLYIYSEGDCNDAIGKKYADIITDNIYTYCKPGSYLRCSVDAFSQIHDVLEGKRVPQPMKYACNTILGLLIAFFITFLYVYKKSRLQVATDKLMLKGGDTFCNVSDVHSVMTNHTKVYSPRSSGGSGHGGGGGHHGGGGGHRGGGGGHRH